MGQHESLSPSERGSLLRRLLAGAIDHGRWEELKDVLAHTHPAEIDETLQVVDDSRWALYEPRG